MIEEELRVGTTETVKIASSKTGVTTWQIPEAVCAVGLLGLSAMAGRPHSRNPGGGCHASLEAPARKRQAAAYRNWNTWRCIERSHGKADSASRPTKRSAHQNAHFIRPILSSLHRWRMLGGEARVETTSGASGQSYKCPRPIPPNQSPPSPALRGCGPQAASHGSFHHLASSREPHPAARGGADRLLSGKIKRNIERCWQLVNKALSIDPCAPGSNALLVAATALGATNYRYLLPSGAIAPTPSLASTPLSQPPATTPSSNLTIAKPPTCSTVATPATHAIPPSRFPVGSWPQS
jgi:hypothetical protein